MICIVLTFWFCFQLLQRCVVYVAKPFQESMERRSSSVRSPNGLLRALRCSTNSGRASESWPVARLEMTSNNSWSLKGISATWQSCQVWSRPVLCFDFRQVRRAQFLCSLLLLKGILQVVLGLAQYAPLPHQDSRAESVWFAVGLEGHVV